MAKFPLKSVIVALFASVASFCQLTARIEYRVLPVADIPVGGQSWDLTACETSGDEWEYRVDEGPVLTRVWSPVMRCDFCHRGDTVLQQCAETRAYRVFFAPGIVMELPGDSAGTSVFSMKGRVRQHDFITGRGVSHVGQARRGRLIGYNGDMLPAALLRHDTSLMSWYISADSLLVIDDVPDSLILTTTIDTYRIETPYELFPVALKRVTTTRYGEVVVMSDNIAWIRAVTPPAEATQLRSRPLTTDIAGDSGSKNDISESDPDSSPVVITISADGTLLLTTRDAEVPCRIAVTDMLGRQYMDIQATADQSGLTVSIAHLPAGEYLVQAIPIDGSPPSAIKISIK